MCGINGFNFKSEVLIGQMNRCLSHRGPDGLSYYIDDKVSLGHARLSIIDLSKAANQPMFYSYRDRKISIVFNGEIYNYIELKEILHKKGYPFHTSSDTEVIMAAYLEWGEKCVNTFNGMWAFCLYDMDNDVLFCSRDRLGVKPFYYYNDSEKFVFSSEIKSITKHSELRVNTHENISKESVELYFSLGFIPAPRTIYRNIWKLEAGHNLLYDLKSKSLIRNTKYFKFPHSDAQAKRSDLVEEGKELLRDAVKLRMRSDVPVGAFLSGGLDSSAVVGEMRHFTDLNNLHTFSIGFDEAHLDETAYINVVKDHFKTKHHHHIYTEGDFLAEVRKYSYTFDEPFGDYSFFPGLKVCEMARKEVAVVLSGDGGDEIFGGYPIYSTGLIYDRISLLPMAFRKIMLKTADSLKTISPFIRKVKETLELTMSDKNSFYANMFASERYKPDVYRNWTSEKLSETLELSRGNLSEGLRIYDLLFNTLSNNYLVKVDRTSMSKSIEVRSPFLDYRFIGFAEKIPTKYKVSAKNSKILMRDIIKGIVPDDILTRNKMGFTPPLFKWVNKLFSPEIYRRYCDYLKAFDSDLYSFYTRLISSNDKMALKDYNIIKLMIFAQWYEYWILNKDES